MLRKRAGASRRLFGFVIAWGVCGGALAFAAGMGVDNVSQLAVGNMADLQCVGGKDAHCPCGRGIDRRTGKCGSVPGGGKIGCPCRDVTSGDEAASGKCAAVGKCKADKADGKMPMLPMLPMPMMMPKMDMPMMPANCPPKSTSNTTSTSTANGARATTDSGGSYDPNCPENFGAQSGGNFWGSVWDSVNPFSSPDDMGSATDHAETGDARTANSIWSNLMRSLGISNTSGLDDTVGIEAGTDASITSTTTGGLTSSKTGPGAEITAATIDFAKTDSTFTYKADPDEFKAEASTVLDQIKKTLKSLLDIVNSWR